MGGERGWGGGGVGGERLPGPCCVKAAVGAPPPPVRRRRPVGCRGSRLCGCAHHAAALAHHLRYAGLAPCPCRAHGLQGRLDSLPEERPNSRSHPPTLYWHSTVSVLQNDYGSEEAKKLGQEVIARESQIGLSESAQVGGHGRWRWGRVGRACGEGGPVLLLCSGLAGLGLPRPPAHGMGVMSQKDAAQCCMQCCRPGTRLSPAPTRYRVQDLTHRKLAKVNAGEHDVYI